MRNTPKWENIDTVVLDMDGTLLDLHYDNLVWNEMVPQALADQDKLSLQDAKQHLLTHMQEINGSIEFYSFEYWAHYTGLDLVAVHRQATNLIEYRPQAKLFLRWLRSTHRQVILATNAHPDSLMVKDEFTQISMEVDVVVSSHDYQAPKEAVGFWQALQRQHPFDPSTCLFVDDNEPVLDAAAQFGVEHLLCINIPDSSKPQRDGLRYPSFNGFGEICPAIEALHAPQNTTHP